MLLIAGFARSYLNARSLTLALARNEQHSSAFNRTPALLAALRAKEPSTGGDFPLLIVDGFRSREKIRVPRAVFVVGPIRCRRTLGFERVAR